jgi:hypothetical protein
MDYEDLIQAIRAHPDFGLGSCSVIDECYSDEELVEHFGSYSSVQVALIVVRTVHNMWMEGMANARNCAF